MIRRAAFWQWTIVIVAVLALEVLCRTGVLSPRDMTAPSAMVERLWQLLQQPKYLTQIRTTVANVLASVLLGIVIGFIVAAILHALPRVRRAVAPLLMSYFALPFFVLYPLLVVLQGMNNTPIITISTLAASIAMAMGALDGFDRIAPVLRKTSRALRLTPVAATLTVSLPATLPYLFAGAKLAIAYAVTSVIGAEFIMSSGGLGYAISFAYNNFENATMYALLLLVILMVTLLLMALNAIEARLRYSASSGVAVAAVVLARGTRAERWLEGSIVTIALLALWQLLHWVSSGEALTSPWDTLLRIVRLFQSPAFYANVAETGRRSAWRC